MRKPKISFETAKFCSRLRGGRGFTMIELLVVIAVISILIAILAPVIGQVRSKACRLIKVSNQGQIVRGVIAFATDNNDRLPQSTAKLATSSEWNWWHPATLIAKFPYQASGHRAVSEYLDPYIPDGRLMYCPNAPKEYKHSRQSWDDGNEWDNPATPFPKDYVVGTYLLLWNYEGYLGPGRTFKGPRTGTRRRNESGMLMCDSIFSHNYRMYEPYGGLTVSSITEHVEGNYGSCEKFARSCATDDRSSAYEADYWYRSGKMPLIEAHAGYIDGSVQSFTTEDVVEMRVIIDPETNTPYPDSLDALGTFYLPRTGL